LGASKGMAMPAALGEALIAACENGKGMGDAERCTEPLVACMIAVWR
jgi:hypothetical protein